MKRFALTLLFVALSSLGAPIPDYYRLYEAAKEKYTVFRGQPLPSRVYGVYEPRTKKWLLRLSDAEGKFAEPAEALLPGAILSGKFLGIESKLNFLLEKNGNWKATSKKEEHRFRRVSRADVFRVFIPR